MAVELQNDLDDILSLHLNEFFDYICSIRYGYKDRNNNLHFLGDEDFKKYQYSFSTPEQIIDNNCGWCWDLSELIKLYCRKNGIACKSFFLEYLSNDFHHTHTQVLACINGKWSACPDNSMGTKINNPDFNTLEECFKWMKDSYIEYLKYVLDDNFDNLKLSVKEYDCIFNKNITEDEYLNLIRK